MKTCRDFKGKNLSRSEKLFLFVLEMGRILAMV